MTEKRFTMDLDGFFYDNHRKKNSANIYDNNTFIGSVIIGAKFIIDLLNELDEKYVDEFALRETLQQELQRSEEENEQLKNHIQELQKHCKRLENENEQIKQVIKEAYETERTHIGKSVLKQLLNNIGEI